MAASSAEDDRMGMEALLAQLGVDRVYGEPRREGEVTIIPVAEVTVGWGYGSGQGPAEIAESHAEGAAKGDAAGGEGKATAITSGSGGGAGGRVTPRGYLRITADRVTYEPILDVQRLALAGILLTGWTVFWLARTARAFARR